jgi:hypothetical protein
MARRCARGPWRRRRGAASRPWRRRVGGLPRGLLPASAGLHRWPLRAAAAAGTVAAPSGVTAGRARVGMVASRRCGEGGDETGAAGGGGRAGGAACTGTGAAGADEAGESTFEAGRGTGAVGDCSRCSCSGCSCVRSGRRGTVRRCAAWADGATSVVDLRRAVLRRMQVRQRTGRGLLGWKSGSQAAEAPTSVPQVRHRKRRQRGRGQVRGSERASGGVHRVPPPAFGGSLAPRPGCSVTSQMTSKM